jgi:amino acid transporter
VQYWTDQVPLAAWITLFFVVIIVSPASGGGRLCHQLLLIGQIASIFGTLGYAEEEFWSSCLKLVVVVMFIFIGIICICGGGPSGGEYDQYIGGRYWQDPGALANGFKGVCSVFVTAAFSFAGTELVGLAATETPDPRKTLPSAVKNTFWRITLIYITSLTIIGLAIPFNDPDLFDGSGADISPVSPTSSSFGLLIQLDLKPADSLSSSL